MRRLFLWSWPTHVAITSPAQRCQAQLHAAAMLCHAPPHRVAERRRPYVSPVVNAPSRQMAQNARRKLYVLVRRDATTLSEQPTWSLKVAETHSKFEATTCFWRLMRKTSRSCLIHTKTYANVRANAPRAHAHLDTRNSIKFKTKDHEQTATHHGAAGRTSPRLQMLVSARPF